MRHWLSIAAAAAVPVFMQTAAAATDPCAPGRLTHPEDVPQTPAFAEQFRAPAPARPSNFRMQILAAGLVRPWSIALLPEKDKVLVTERSGQMRVVDTRLGLVSKPLEGLPTIADGMGGGLYAVLLDPLFASNRRVYFSYTAPPADGHKVEEPEYQRWVAAAPEERVPFSIGIPRVASARLSGDLQRLEDVKVIFEGGSRRLAWGADGTLFITSSGPAPVDRPPDMTPQRLQDDLGKVLRINADGSIPKDNPFVGREGARPEIYAFGVRDIQGIALNPRTRELWTSEHGPRGGDELNIIRAGHNYGYPVITYGRNYSGAPINGGKAAEEGMDQPAYFWVPSIGPSGMAFYSGNLFPRWRNSLFVASLPGRQLIRLELKGDKVVAEERLLHERCKRVRDVAVDRDGAVYVITDESNGELLKLTP